jgi:hypothetical protein
MVQYSEDFCFALKAGQSLHVGRYDTRENLDGDRALQVRVGRPVHFAHSAHADLGTDLEWTDPRTGG